MNKFSTVIVLPLTRLAKFRQQIGPSLFHGNINLSFFNITCFGRKINSGGKKITREPLFSTAFSQFIEKGRKLKIFPRYYKIFPIQFSVAGENNVNWFYQLANKNKLKLYHPLDVRTCVFGNRKLTYGFEAFPCKRWKNGKEREMFR